MGINDGVVRGSGPNDSQTWGRYGTNGSSNLQSLTCPPGSFAYGVLGKSGADVNQLSGLKCKNVITGATQDVNGGPLGTSTGGNGGGLWSGNGDGLAGFRVRAETEVEGIKTVYRGGNGLYDDGSRMGDSRCASQNQDVCDANYLVNTVSGATSQSKQYLTNFSFGCRNFSNMAAIGKSPLACCVGQDASQDCADVRQYLSCPAVVRNYCSAGTNIFTDPACLAGVAKPDAYNGLDATTVANLRLRSCAAGNNYSTAACSDFCTAKTGIDIPIPNTSTDALTAGSTIKAGCNTLYATRCQMDSSPSVCGCQRPWESYDGHTDIPDNAAFPKVPACYFNTCRNFGYFSQPLTALGCPSCVQLQQFNISGTNATLNNIQQSCQTTASSTDAPVGGSAAAASQTKTSAAPQSQAATGTAGIWGLLIAVGLLLLLACSLLAVLAI